MWLFRETGILSQESRTAAALQRALDEGRIRKSISKGDRQILSRAAASDLPGMNQHARILWARAICQELSDAFSLDPRKPYPTFPLFLVTLVDAKCTTSDDAQQVDADRFKATLRRGLKGLSYVGMIEPALYVSLAQELRVSPDRRVWWHLHAIVWGCTKAEISALMRQLNREERYQPIANGLRGADARQIRQTGHDLADTLRYILESPCNEYRIGKRRSLNRDGELVFKSNKSWARKASLIRLFQLMKALYLDELAVAGGQGTEILRRAKRRALCLSKNPRHDWKLSSSLGTVTTPEVKVR